MRHLPVYARFGVPSFLSSRERERGAGGSLDPRVESRLTSLAACGSGTHSGPNVPGLEPRGLTYLLTDNPPPLPSRASLSPVTSKKNCGSPSEIPFFLSEMFSLPTGPSLFWIARPFWRLQCCILQHVGNAAYAGSGHVARRGW